MRGSEFLAEKRAIRLAFIPEGLPKMTKTFLIANAACRNLYVNTRSSLRNRMLEWLGVLREAD